MISITGVFNANHLKKFGEGISGEAGPMVDDIFITHLYLCCIGMGHTAR
jgi:hypothetical protein